MILSYVSTLKDVFCEFSKNVSVFTSSAVNHMNIHEMKI